MFHVLKRSGKVEAFVPQKVTGTIDLTASENGILLNMSDLRNVEMLITERLTAKDKDLISSEEIYIELIGVLVDLNLRQVAELYSKYVNNYYKDTKTRI